MNWNSYSQPSLASSWFTEHLPYLASRRLTLPSLLLYWWLLVIPSLVSPPPSPLRWQCPRTQTFIFFYSPSTFILLVISTDLMVLNIIYRLMISKVTSAPQNSKIHNCLLETFPWMSHSRLEQNMSTANPSSDTKTCSSHSPPCLRQGHLHFSSHSGPKLPLFSFAHTIQNLTTVHPLLSHHLIWEYHHLLLRLWRWPLVSGWVLWEADTMGPGVQEMCWVKCLWRIRRRK